MTFGFSARMASCRYCGHTVPSDKHMLAFWEDRSALSERAIRQCKHCGYYDTVPKHTDHKFESHGAWDTDAYYCGCKGWD